MSNNSLQGLFISLGLKPDKSSFETGNKYIDGVVNGLNKMVATARNASVVMAGMAVLSGKVESAELRTADALGMSTEAMDTWRAAVKIAGADANGFISSMVQMEAKMQKLTLNGTFDEGLARNLGLLGLNYADMANMDSTARTKTIIEAAQAMKDQQKAAILIGDILGNAGAEFYRWMKLSGTSLDEAMAKASGTVLTTEGSKAQAMGFNSEYQELKQILDQVTKLFGSEIAGGLTPALKELNKWLISNKDNIAAIANALGVIAAWAADKIGKVGAGALESAGYAIEAVKEAKAGNTEAAIKAMDNSGKALAFGSAAAITGTTSSEAERTWNDTVSINAELARRWTEKFGVNATFSKKRKLPFESLPEDLQEGIIAAGGKSKFKNYINDGIIRPDGTITQVAPDDWVLAARDLGDLAAAFIPQAPAGTMSAGEFIINQTINVTGAQDLAGTIRQQAYNGAHDGLLDVMAQSSRRLQMMPGAY